MQRRTVLEHYLGYACFVFYPELSVFFFLIYSL